MSADQSSSNKNQGDNDVFIFIAMSVAALMLVPILVVALPFSIFLKALLGEEDGNYKFLVGVVFVISFYVFFLGINNDIYEGLCFSGLNNSTLDLFNELMRIKPDWIEINPKYPEHIRFYLYLSLPASLVMTFILKGREAKKRKDSFLEQSPKGVFDAFILGIRIFGFPYEAAFKGGLFIGSKLFSTKKRVLSFSLLSLMLSYILIYLTLGPINNWFIHFGYFINKLSPGLFDYLSPVGLSVFKSIIYFSGLWYLIILAIRIRDFEIETREKKNNSEGKASVYLGKDHTGKKFELSNPRLNHHVHVVGASGFGKTTLLTNIIKSKIRAGEGLIFTDLKGDIDTIREIISYTIEEGRSSDFELFSISEDFLEMSSNLSLFENGNSLEIKDKIMGAFRPEHDYYKKRMESFLLITLRGLVWLRDNKGIIFDFESIYKLIGQFEEIESLAAQIDHPEIRNDIEKLINDKKLKEDLTGLRADIESLVKTDFGALLSGSGGINFYNSILQGKIVFIHLDSQRYETTAERLGRLILQDIKTASAKIVTTIPKEESPPYTLIVDEFANIATEQFVSFLNRARASGIGIVIAHQELSDLDVFSPTVKDQVMTNTSTLISFLQKLPDSAEIISGIAGTITTEKDTTQFEEEGLIYKTQKETGMGSKREVEEYIIHPNLVKNLSVGECFVISKYPPPVIAKLFVNRSSPKELVSIEKMKGFLVKNKRGSTHKKTSKKKAIVEEEGDWLDV